MGRVPCCQKDEGLKKGPWTPEEDQKLISFIDKHGHENWRALPKRCGLLRCGKSCRLRWTNYLRPDIKRGRFSQSEEQKIIQLHALVGNKWSFIASQLPKRTDNEIKNYWNTVLKKRMQKISSMFASAQRLLNRKPAASSSSTISSDTITATATATATATTNLISPATNLLNSSSSSNNDASFSSSPPPPSSMLPPPQDTSSSLLSWSFSINPNNKSTTACSNHISSKTSLLSDILANNANSTPNPNSKMSQLATVINANAVTSPTITNPNPNPNSGTTTTLSTNASSSSSSSSVASSSSSSSSTSSSSFSHLAQWESARLQAEARLNINASIRPAAAGCSNSSLLKMNHINSNIMGAATTTTANSSNNVVTSSWLSSPINPSLVPAESPTCNNSYNHKYKLNHRSKQQQNRSSSSSSFSLPVDGFNANNNNVDTMSVNPTLKRSSSTINDSTPSPKYSKADADATATATATANAQAINICSLLLANYKSNSRLNGNNNNNNSSSNNNNFMARSMSMNLSSDRKAVGKIDTNNDDDVLPKTTNPEPCITSALKLGPNGKLTWKTKDLSQLLVSKANTNSISSGPALSAQCSRNKRLWQSEPSPKVAKASNLSNNSRHMKSARLDQDAIHDQFMNNVHADRPSSNVNPTSTSISPRNIIDQVIDSHHMDVIQSTGRGIMAIGSIDIDDDSNMVDMDNLSEILLQMESSATCTDDQDHDNIVSTSAWPNQSNDDRLDMVGKGGINPIMEVLNIGEEEEEEEEGEGEDLEVEIGEEEGNDEDRADETNDDDHQYKYISKNGKCLDGYSKKNSTSISSADDYAAINDDHPFSQMIMGDDHNNHFNTGYYHHQHSHDIMMMMMMNQYGNNSNKDYNMVLPKLVTSDHHDGLITRPSMNSSTNHIHHQHAMYDDHDHQYYNNDSMSGLLMINPYHDEDNDQESCSLLIDHEAMGSHDLLMLGGAAAADDHEIITNGQSSFHMDEILMDHSLLSGKDADADLNVDSIDTSNASQYALQFETLVRELLES